MDFNPLGIKQEVGRSKFAITADIIQHIMKTDGIAGFYRGYTASLCTYVPNSALWWAFYHLYQGMQYLIFYNLKEIMFIITFF